jgi:hypothetical protein
MFSTLFRVLFSCIILLLLFIYLLITIIIFVFVCNKQTVNPPPSTTGVDQNPPPPPRATPSTPHESPRNLPRPTANQTLTVNDQKPSPQPNFFHRPTNCFTHRNPPLAAHNNPPSTGHNTSFKPTPTPTTANYKTLNQIHTHNPQNKNKILPQI